MHSCKDIGVLIVVLERKDYVLRRIVNSAIKIHLLLIIEARIGIMNET